MDDTRMRFIVCSTEDPLREDGPNVIENLNRSPKKIASMYVYDRRGTELFEQQCNTTEYYLRRAETDLLKSHAAEIVEHCGLIPLVELGAGTAEKTRILLSHYEAHGSRYDYYPMDVDTESLREAACRLVSEFAHLRVHCLGTTYDQGLRSLPLPGSPRLLLFLGSSIGNMELAEIDELLAQIVGNGVQGDYLLLGADLDKDPAIIDAAYNDSAGYGPQSTLNMLPHLNRRYNGNFVADKFSYRSRYDPRSRRNEVSIVSLVHQTVTLAELGFSVSFSEGESIDAEVMWKFDPDELGAILDRAGFSLARRWIDSTYRYGLFLLRRR